MPKQYGTSSLQDTLSQVDISVYEYGEDKLYSEFQTILDIHNNMLSEMLSELAEYSKDNIRRWGNDGGDFTMIEADEYSVPDSQKVAPSPVNVGFPLSPKQVAVQWTKRYLERTTVAELTAQMVKITDSDVRALTNAVKNAVFKPTNNLTYIDKFGRGLTLPIRALLNADSTYIPVNPITGQTFDGSTHTHYMVNATLNATSLNALINNVAEHHSNGKIVVYISQADETTVRGITGFFPYVDPRLIVNAANNETPNVRLDIENISNRAIGIFGRAEIWVKSWIPANYLFCINVNADKPLVIRTASGQAPKLAIIFEYEQFPLRAKAWENEYGVSVYNRSNGAVLFIDAGGVYVQPTFS